MATSKANGYFYNRTLTRKCTDCRILAYCRGGCRVVNCTKPDATKVTCTIKEEVIKYALGLIKDSPVKKTIPQQLDEMINTYVAENVTPENIKSMFVETPPLD